MPAGNHRAARVALRIAITSGLIVAALSASTPAFATEHEWHTGGSFGYAMIDFPRGLARNGFGGGFHARYGLTDAIDVTMNASLFGFPTDDRIAPQTTAGISYVVDVSRWFATVGVDAGVMDLIGVASCDELPSRCGHIVMPAVGVPVTLEFRVVPEVPIGVRFEYQLLFLGGPSQAMFVGAYAAFAK
ncbi:MAG: hypothetical protein HOW73_20775 [Polyangiaceae bacterium]|nr:hypothetical protein [Polyangiaceae bacterium]